MSGWHIVWIGVFTGTIQQLNLGEEKASDIVFRKKTFQKKDNLTSVKFNIVKIQMLWILALKSFKENNEVEKIKHKYLCLLSFCENRNDNGLHVQPVKMCCQF